MAIRMRRGSEADFVPEKLQTGEIAVCVDTGKVFAKAENRAIELTGSEHKHKIADVDGLQSKLDNIAANVIVDDEMNITEDTMLYIDPDAIPDRFPERFYGTDVKGTGSGISVTVNGAAPSDEYLNTSTGNLYVMNAAGKWDYKSCLNGIKGDKGDEGPNGKQGIPGTDIYHGVKYIGHRGLSSLAPENTIPSFSAAASHGMWGAECDIWETSDGNFIVCHNPTVDAATNGTGSIADKTLAQLKALTVDAWNNIAKYPNLKMPTLEEYLDCCKLYGIVPVIEIKNMSDTAVPSFIEIVRNKGMENTATVISFDHATLNLIRTISNINMQYLFDSTTLTTSSYTAQIDAVAEIGNADIDIYRTTASKDVVSYAHSCGLRVNVWTVDNPTEIYKLLVTGVDFITTNVAIDDMTLSQKPVEQITINSNDDAAARITSVLSLGTSTTTVETSGNVNTYYYNDTTGILSINSSGDGGIHCNFGCKTGDVVAAEYEFYAYDNVPKLSIGSRTLDPAAVYGSYGFHGNWQAVRLAVPVAVDGSIDVYIGKTSGIYRLKNIVIKHIKYHNPTDASTGNQEWITASLASPAEHHADFPVQFCKHNGMVYIRGWFKNWDKNSLNRTNAMFNLPIGYRPGQELNYTVPVSGTGAGVSYTARVKIDTAGAVNFGSESVAGQIAKGCSACVPPFLAEN